MLQSFVYERRWGDKQPLFIGCKVFENGSKEQYFCDIISLVRCSLAIPRCSYLYEGKGKVFSLPLKIQLVGGRP
jgi:hypothetical protein